MIEITLNPKKVSLLFSSIVVLLTLVHTAVLALSFQFDDNPVILILVELFDLDLEANIPSLYSAFAILVCSLLFFVIALYKREHLNYEKLCWLGLGFIFFFLASDEAFQIHEQIGDITENYVKATGFLYFPWVVPYVLVMIVLILLYLKFLLGLPKKTTILFMVSAIVYLTGAIVFDMLGGREAELHDYDSIAYYVLYTVEEFLEMTGIVILMFTQLAYIERQFGYIGITLQIRKVQETCGDNISTDSHGLS
jgi:hypothetical protein